MSNVFPMKDHRGQIWQASSKRRRPSEGELADRFADRHSKVVRFLTAAERPGRKAQWIVCDGDEWQPDDANLAQRLAREICREAAEAFNYPALDSARSVDGVLALAKSDPRLVVSGWPCHPDLETAVDEWMEERCVLDPGAWTARPAMLASTAGWERFDADELSEALKARGIVYRRRGNVHGFNGVRLKGDADE